MSPVPEEQADSGGQHLWAVIDEGAFTLLRPPDPELPDLAYLEHLGAGLHPTGQPTSTTTGTG